jgi:hypothetical protein
VEIQSGRHSRFLTGGETLRSFAMMSNFVQAGHGLSRRECPVANDVELEKLVTACSEESERAEVASPQESAVGMRSAGKIAQQPFCGAHSYSPSQQTCLGAELFECSAKAYLNPFWAGSLYWRLPLRCSPHPLDRSVIHGICLQHTNQTREWYARKQLPRHKCTRHALQM